MKVINQGQYLIIHMDDKEVEAMIERLQAVVDRRRALAAVEPAMLQWADGAAWMPGTVDGVNRVISFSIVKLKE